MVNQVIQTEVYADSFVTGGTSDPGNATGAPDGVFTTDTGNTNWTGRWLMELPPTEWYEGNQAVTIRVRKEPGQSGDPDIMGLHLYQNGNEIRNLLPSAHTVTSPTGEDVSATFDASEVSPGAIEIEINTRGAGGNPNARASVQLDAITWVASHLEFRPGSKFQGYDGAVWQQGELRRWNGDRWIPAVAKRWTGSEWEEV